MANTLTFDAAHPKDLPALKALHAANWRCAYAGLLPAAVFGGPMAAYMDRKWAACDTDGMQVRVLHADAEILGFVALFDTGPEGVFIDNLHVASGARGQGGGKALMMHAASVAGPRPVALEVLDGNQDARAIYRHWGGAEGPMRHATLLGAQVAERTVTWRSGHVLAAQINRGTP